MRIRTMLLAALAALMLPALATGVAVAGTVAGTSAAGSKAATVSVRNTKLGRVLVDGRGRTLYLFLKDKNGKSACAGACAAAWPPLMTHGKPKAGSGADAKLLGTTVRKSGTEVTYAGHPLYTYVGDSKAGQTNGQRSTSFGAPWYVLAASGHQITKG